MTRIEEIREHQKVDEALEEKYGVKLTSIADRAYLLSELDEAVRLLRVNRPSSRPIGCWCEDNRDVARFGHSNVCRDTNTFLARHPEAK